MRCIDHAKSRLPTKTWVRVAPILLTASIAAKPATLAKSNAPTVVPTGNQGELDVSWNHVPGAQFYTIGWINKEEFQLMLSAGRDWLDAFHYATVGSAYNSHTVSGLKPVGEYCVIIGAQTYRFGGAVPSWSDLVTTAGQHGAGFVPSRACPCRPPVTCPSETAPPTPLVACSP